MRPSIQLTDHYKFSMRAAGFPDRVETFYYTHRKGGFNGMHLMPVDPGSFVRSLLPLRWHNEPLKISGVTQWGWFHNREPAFSVTGRSEVVSWLEPLVLQLQFRIQAATQSAYADATGERFRAATCAEERELIGSSLCKMNGQVVMCGQTRVDSLAYETAIFLRAEELIAAVGSAERIFEVGLRGCSCPEQHAIALEAMKAAGLLYTSNCYLAGELGIQAVGTMGHEHVMRHGSDEAAFSAMVNNQGCSFLPDTFDTKRLGLPAAFTEIGQFGFGERPDARRKRNRAPFTIRFDSAQGARENYAETVATLKRIDPDTILAFESGWNLELVREFEALREQYNWPAGQQMYGFGTYLIAPPWPTFSREDVGAVWKLSQTGDTAVMKFGDESDRGKESLPGRPVAMGLGRAGCVQQEGENWRPGADMLNSPTIMLSPETRALMARCAQHRADLLERASKGE